MKIPLNLGAIHFVGIGGIGMSGIAEVLHKLGYKIQGSDQKENANTKRLQNLGIKIFINHDAKNIQNAEVIVVSSAVSKQNVEYKNAVSQNLPVVKRAEMLAELMRFKRTIAIGGTHGKTTTTSLVSALLAGAGYEPTVVNGGIINEYGSNAIHGDGEWMVVEADESDGSFLKLPADVAIITNIDPEHLDFYGNFSKLKKAFLRFVENIPFYGFAVLCTDNEYVNELKNNIHTRKIITYGQNEQADVRFFINNDKKSHKFGTYFDIELKYKKDKIKIKDFFIPMLGIHNVANATASIVTALELGIDKNIIKEALKNFSGVKRRFTYIASWKNAEIFDDYGHHPTEIKAVLKAAKKNSIGKIIAVMQPHRYSRLNNLFEDFSNCFEHADIAIITPVYSAGEKPIFGATSEELVKQIKLNKISQAYFVKNQVELAKLLNELTAPNDYIIFLGAGDITAWAAALPMNLKKYD